MQPIKSLEASDSGRLATIFLISSSFVEPLHRCCERWMGFTHVCCDTTTDKIMSYITRSNDFSAAFVRMDLAVAASLGVHVGMVLL